MTATANPIRGEIWDVRFDPSVGAEIQKVRPAVVVNHNAIGKLPLRIVVPITDWKTGYVAYPWMVNLQPSKANGLTKESGADSFQVKSVSVHRFVRRIGTLVDAELDNIASAISLCVDAP
jgi:mRNA interferase MazF